ncbi:MAG: 3-dehydroquinate synthase [Gammaproteobacteria bacterium]|nr:3-dehydroquinate synthase [Gammaproteobacteria bacterium]
MKEILVSLGEKSYPIYIGENVLKSVDLFSKVLNTTQVLVITNTTVEKLYAKLLLDTLNQYDPELYVIEDGESYKSLDVINDIITQLLQRRFSRNCIIIALGGGVVGDISGFAAACYQRGVGYIQVPTTLLAQVDSSVGGKTAVNHALGKNMIGAFHQPLAVVSDTTVLSTLPDRELVAGLAEIIKYGLIRDYDFFCWLESNINKLLARDNLALQEAIERSCINKAIIVAEDEKEKGLRALLNFGHTFGHAIETGLAYKDWLHGEAVGLGMFMAAEMSHRQGWLDRESLKRIESILSKVQLPLVLPEKMLDTDMRDLMSVDKKATDKGLRLVLLKEIGRALVTSEYEEQYLSQTLNHFREAAR